MLCVGAGVTGSLAPWDAKSSVYRLFVSRVYVSNYQVIYHPIIQVFIFHPSIFSFECDLFLQSGPQLEIRADRSRKLLERIRQMTTKEASAFATLAEDLIVLPFPSAYETLPRERFSMSENEDWNYVQRAKFKELLTVCTS